ncbi:MAG TPA: hypothetical protein DDZ51_01780 [Planctomycetaceae bacterium]|nr:hypothetical protein [Planctomycetaceae bacterium]
MYFNSRIERAMTTTDLVKPEPLSSVGPDPVGGLSGGEGAACMGIDLGVAAGDTPGSELLRVNYYPHNLNPAQRELLLSLFCTDKPISESVGQFVGVSKH